MTDRNNGRTVPGVPGSVSSIPLSDLDPDPQDASIGQLVKSATAQMSTLVRAEVELAKSEVTGEIKKGVLGSVLFIVAGVILLFSTFFFFFFLGELLSVWLPSWAAYLIVFGIQLLVAGALAVVGFLRLRKIRAPRKTIDSVKEMSTVLPGGGAAAPQSSAPTAGLR